jgi:hypothetical protein
MSRRTALGLGKSKLKFTAIGPVDAAVDAFTVPAGFTWQPVIRWGDPLFHDSPAVDAGATPEPGQARIPRPTVVQVFRTDDQSPTLPQLWRLFG